MWDGMASFALNEDNGFDGAVRTVRTVIDGDYIAFSGAVITNPVLYVGGDFTMVDDVARDSSPRFTPNSDNPNNGFTWQSLGGGINLPGARDRLLHRRAGPVGSTTGRPSSRLSIRVDGGDTFAA